ncbi:MAG: N-acetyltransferase [Anaerolineae bacterium]|nr:MAG: N-acetyltransferase [Anaerolineae bacterium]
MISGEGIRLRAVEEVDLPLFVRWLNDPEVRRGITVYRPLSLAAERRWFEAALQRPPDERPFVIEVCSQGEWVAIGNIGLHRIDWRNRSAEVGIMIGEKEYWNQGYGRAAMRLMLSHAFDTLNLQRVSLQVYANNPRAIRSYEKSGFVLEGRLRQAHYQDGVYHDVLVMSVLRPEWQDRHLHGGE